ncbi:alpha/beta hydrolase [Streptomyces sp. HNM0574]|uniref:alpha/beta fold hydrolase n=1 Tax=Streptomyces sp. HNM0574 TaxID=2714954 RepID=UPI00146C7B98|nr:alpha/beta hydrolase [Streptomyces sp. HNM0574]NLU67053.1 alpha/beta hydrolase [Streptomyces sp. HNM0574]
MTVESVDTKAHEDAAASPSARPSAAPADRDGKETIHSLSVDGLRYAYRVLHQPEPVTEPVLVVGGALQGMLGWPQLDDHIGPAATVVTADLPGMGSADPLPPEVGTEILQRAIDGIIDDLGVPKVNLFGFSYGAALTFNCAQRTPDRVARLLLGGVPAHIGPEQRAQWLRATQRLAAGQPEEFATLATGVMMCLDEERTVANRTIAYRYVRRSILHAALHSPHATAALQRALRDTPDFSGGLSGVPTLVFTGEHDTVTGPERQREFAGTIADGRFVTLADSDHWVVLERSQEVADLALRFFTDRAALAAPYLTAPLDPAR